MPQALRQAVLAQDFPAIADNWQGGQPLVLMPNPFYQIYEGAALLADVRAALQGKLAHADPRHYNTVQKLAYLLVIADSLRLGMRWVSDGPQAGYFPFYIGLLMNIASLINLLKALRANREIPFVSRAEIRLVLAIFVPSLVYVLSLIHI